MLPLFASGDFIVTFYSRMQAGDAVVMKLPVYGYVLKRLQQVQNQTVLLGSDNQEYFSSCCGVWQSKKHLVGKVLLSINFKGKGGIRLNYKAKYGVEYPMSN